MPSAEVPLKHPTSAVCFAEADCVTPNAFQKLLDGFQWHSALVAAAVATTAGFNANPMHCL